MKFLLTIWPPDLVTQVTFETKASVIHFRSWLFQRSKFRGQKHLKLNIGCGPKTVTDWVNIDLGGSGVFPWDCRRTMPFDDGAVESIFSEHCFEHIDQAASARFLSECHRCLQPGGVVRIVVPDAGKYLRLYSGDWNGFVPVRPLIEENGKYRDYWMRELHTTKMEFINAVFRQWTEHKFAYDAETLMLRMREAGFGQVIHQSFGVSAGNVLLDSEERASESLYVEGVK
jgi:predicted SAM-dependent methyltransferase